MPDMIQGVNVEVLRGKRPGYVIVTTRVLAKPVTNKHNCFCIVFRRPRTKEPLAR